MPDTKQLVCGLSERECHSKLCEMWIQYQKKKVRAIKYITAKWLEFMYEPISFKKWDVK